MVLKATGIDIGFAALSAPGIETPRKALQKSTTLNLAFRINDRLSFTTGIGMQQMQMQAWNRHDKPLSSITDSVQVMDQKRELSYYYYYDTAVTTQRNSARHVYNSVIIPVGVDYAFNTGSKLQFGIGTTVAFGRLLSGERYNTDKLPLGSKTAELSYTETNTFTKLYNLQWSCRISVGYSVSRHISVTLSPVYSRMLTKMTQTGTGSTSQFSGYGAKAGLMYVF